MDSGLVGLGAGGDGRSLAVGGRWKWGGGHTHWQRQNLETGPNWYQCVCDLQPWAQEHAQLASPKS
jgi:hypothetical protein